ncbi:CoA transferase [Rhodococcus jostii]|uniref:CoA transferase n=1 Tax=Rhodococcus jostii TaxID=132919 RepID=UPI003633E391
MLPGTTYPLNGVRVIEGMTFVAAPSGWHGTRQLGAEAIRVDPPPGGSTTGGADRQLRDEPVLGQPQQGSNKSVTVNYRRLEGRELLLELMAVTSLQVLRRPIEPSCVKRRRNPRVDALNRRRVSESAEQPADCTRNLGNPSGMG